MERKIIKIGNSFGIIIPSTYLDDLDVAYGDSVDMDYNKDLGVIVIRNTKTTPDTNYIGRVIKDAVDEYLNNKSE